MPREGVVKIMRADPRHDFDYTLLGSKGKSTFYERGFLLEASPVVGVQMAERICALRLGVNMRLTHRAGGGGSPDL
ncbi:hypothetical protein D9M71_834600 [compost metagenome]